MWRPSRTLGRRLVVLLVVGSGAASVQAQPDIVFGNSDTSRVCLQDAGGNFTCSDVDAGLSASHGVALADVDGQNGPDIVFANDGLTNRVCLNDGSANFTCRDVSDDTDLSDGVAVADFDGQNGPDLVFANDNAQRNRVCLNDGSGNFTCSDVSADTYYSRAVAAADLDGQNGPDLVFANWFGAPDQACLNDGGGNFTCRDVNIGDFSQAVAVADLDAQNGPDLVFAHLSASTPGQVCLNDGTGAFTCSDVSPVIKPTLAVAAADVDGQNGPDIVFADSTGNRLCLNDGTGAFTCSALSVGTSSNNGVAIGDVDGQNGPDLVFANPGLNRLCLNDGSGNFACSNVSTDSTVTRAVAVGALRTTDLWITKTDGQTTAVPGGELSYTVTAANAGPIDATGASVSDTLPAELSCTWACAASGGATCTPGPFAGDLADSVDLPAGGMVEYVGTCGIDPGATGSLVNRATVATPFGISERHPEDNEATDLDLLDPQADLAITNTDKQTTAVPGGELTYIITAYNAGPIGVTGASVSDVFPPELDCTWVCTGSGGATCTPGPVAGDLGDSVDLPVDGTASYAVSCVIDPGATGLLINTATVTTPAGVSDPNAANDQVTDSDLLTPRADLAITKDDGVTTAQPGDVLTYTVVASNAGPSDALAVGVEDVFPPELIDCTWICATAGGALCTGGPVAGDLVDSPDLFAGSSATYTATCTVDPTVIFGLLTNTATIIAPAGVLDPDPSNDSGTDQDLGTPGVIFGDGFESGDLSHWSAVVP